MSEKIYVGAGKERKFDNGGSSIKVYLELDNLKKYWEEYGYTSESGKHMLKLDVNTRREISSNGFTHFICIDDWKPDNQIDNYKPAESQNKNNTDDNGIPF